MEQRHADILRYEFPATQPTRGARAMSALSSRVIGPLQRDRRLLVYPIAVLMAIGIGVLGHALRPTSEAPNTAVSASGVDVTTDRAPVDVVAPATEPSESVSNRPR